jgi:hypothetical protein
MLQRICGQELHMPTVLGIAVLGAVASDTTTKPRGPEPPLDCLCSRERDLHEPEIVWCMFRYFLERRVQLRKQAPTACGR